MNGVLFNATLARDPQEKGAGYARLCYMVVTDSYIAGDNQLHNSMITWSPQLELAGTYCNKNIFTQVIKYRKWASLRD